MVIHAADLSTGNRAETVLPNPYDIDFHRPENRPISFGLGTHRCLGYHVARLEMQVLYQERHKRIPNYCRRVAAVDSLAGGSTRSMFYL